MALVLSVARRLSRFTAAAGTLPRLIMAAPAPTPAEPAAAAASTATPAAAPLTTPLAEAVGALPAEAAEVLRYWYPDLDEGGEIGMQSKWFGSTKEDDDEMRERFGHLVEAALEGGLAEWEATHAGCLAKILVLDQLTRNLFRGTPKAFAGDAMAQALTGKVLAEDPSFTTRATLPISVRLFGLMPYMHAEDVALNRTLVEELSLVTAGSPKRQGFMNSAWDHVMVVIRYGRYPHRNKVLGRTNTAAEEAYLSGDAASWGQ